VARRPRSRIGRSPSRTQRQAVPIISTMMGSMTPLLPIIATAPVMPPWGLLILIAWRMLHRNLWPVWMGLPLGLFDDIFSGQPLGSAMMLWTISLLGLDLLDRRMVWRDFTQEWGIAGGLIVAMLFGQLLIAYATGGATNPLFLAPQAILSILAFPLIARCCAAIDEWRLR
jgi:rod shape-determining protein MreD